MLEHSRLGHDRGMATVPDHVAVGLVGKDHELGPAHQTGDRRKIVTRRHAAGRDCGVNSG